MNRRDFLKNVFTVAALAQVTRLAAKEGADGDKTSDSAEGSQITRRPYKNTAQTLPLLGFGMMRLPLVDPAKQDIDYAVAEKMMARAMKAGLNYFDTAYMYHGGLSEKCAGDILSKYPRDSYYLADKMPPWFASDPAGIEKIFKEQLSRCRTEYFDFYLIHSLDEKGWKLAGELKVCEFLEKMKAEGKIRRLGFSFHDRPEVLEKIVKSRKWDFAQIQLNYLDWDIYRSREQYEILTKAGIPVIVMEPLRGGSLASLNPAATKILKTADPDSGNAAWALRYVASLPNVLTVLSGMSLPEQLEENIATFTPFKPLTNAERETLAKALEAYRKKLAVPCTGCRYCMPCPVGVEIPRIFGHYNQYRINGNKWLLSNNYSAIPEGSRASACIACGKCMQHCPQHIDIPRELKKINREMKKIEKEMSAIMDTDTASMA